MRKKKKYLPLYYEWMEKDRLPSCGLCSCFDSYKLKGTDLPYNFSKHPLFRLFYYSHSESNVFWASDDGRAFSFGPTRQNIVLLMAAMNDEL